MEKSWQGRRVPQNLPSFINVCVKNVSAKARQEVEKKAAKKKTRFLDTHPCDADRIRAAVAMNQSGVFHSDKAASDLFKGFDELCVSASRFHYEHNLGMRITDHNLVPHEISERDSESQAEGEQALHDFFFGLNLKLRTIPVPE